MTPFQGVNPVLVMKIVFMTTQQMRRKEFISWNKQNNDEDGTATPKWRGNDYVNIIQEPVGCFSFPDGLETTV